MKSRSAGVLGLELVLGVAGVFAQHGLDQSGDEENLTLLKIISQRIGEYQDALAFHNQEIKYF